LLTIRPPLPGGMGANAAAASTVVLFELMTIPDVAAPCPR
jgi:hypothetical protein